MGLRSFPQACRWRSLSAAGVLAGFVAVLPALPLSAQELSGLARLDVAQSSISDRSRGGLAVRLQITQPVPWRVRLLDEPARLLIDLRELDWSGVEALGREVAGVKAMRAGGLQPGWSRLVVELSGPMKLASAEMKTEGSTQILLELQETSQEDFAIRAAQTDPPGWALPDPTDVGAPVTRGSGDLVVVLDPGHGGLDPGAEAGGLREAHLMLDFARALREELVRAGGIQVVMTRESDEFVPLETRISIARSAGADLFLSLHADALAEGEATGATIYTLSSDAAERAGALLAERHDRDDLLAGIDLTDHDDLVADVLMDMARSETEPRVTRLAEAMRDELRAADLRMHRRPIQSGGFSVLKSPDIPSILLELGFLSSPRDRARLMDPKWQGRMIAALVKSIHNWNDYEAALRAQAPR